MRHIIDKLFKKKKKENTFIQVVSFRLKTLLKKSYSAGQLNALQSGNFICSNIHHAILYSPVLVLLYNLCNRA